MLASILSFIGWSYLPDIATRRLLPVYHHFYRVLLGRQPPPPGTPLYSRHYRYVYAFAVLSYLLYNFYEAAVSMSPNYYELLGVDPVADENTLKLAFRQFARKNHPDRVGAQGEAVFIEVRDAFEALKNPVTRFAYDRFGPEAIHWTHCTTLREYIRHGLMQSAGFHIVAACALLLFSAIGKPSYVAFWRYVLFAAVFAYELTFILSPSVCSPSQHTFSSVLFSEPGTPTHTGFFTWLWPRRVAYQHIRFLHSLFLFMSIALSRVAPVLFPPVGDEFADPQKLQATIERIGLLAKAVERDAAQQIHTELHSVHGPLTNTQPTDSGAHFSRLPPCEHPAPEVMERLSTQMENMFIESKLMDGGPLKSVVDAAVEGRRRAASEQHVTSVRLGIPSPTPSPPPERTPVRRMQATTVSAGNERQEKPVGYIRARSISC
ncbi:chaperone J-domain-containing protein [Laetiporus sulphureus 93-53]|uniref:Chaperone J-domain-containing protein n=1 Tax=Laetiporus sulphureus 93-53 TaxID=1314785 RepID=A0A165DQF7_9APHY|nr:chaperone J-domain-containing protein [Laetiporus sulphureus 93-53]KZT05398.1 chaperone J-domain-containing protein [Laetiporus sulphureus 93-53]